MPLTIEGRNVVKLGGLAGLSEAEQGPDAWVTLQRLAVDLAEAWASGSFERYP